MRVCSSPSGKIVASIDKHFVSFILAIFADAHRRWRRRRRRQQWRRRRHVASQMFVFIFYTRILRVCICEYAVVNLWYNLHIQSLTVFFSCFLAPLNDEHFKLSETFCRTHFLLGLLLQEASGFFFGCKSSSNLRFLVLNGFTRVANASKARHHARAQSSRQTCWRRSLCSGGKQDAINQSGNFCSKGRSNTNRHPLRAARQHCA